MEEKKQAGRFGFNSAECSVSYLISQGSESIAIKLDSLVSLSVSVDEF